MENCMKSALYNSKLSFKTYFQSSVWNDDSQCFILVMCDLNSLTAPYHYCIEVKVLETKIALQLVVRYYMVTPL